MMQTSRSPRSPRSANATDWLAQYPASTAITYGHTLGDFASCCGVLPDMATQADLLSYQASIREQAPATVARKLNTLGSFYKYLQRRGIRPDNPMVAIRMERYRADPLRTIQYLTPEEVSAVLAAASHDRERAILVVLLHGLRLGELVALNVEQYRDAALMGIEGKGGKVRHVPLTAGALPVLERYLGRRRTGPMFLARGNHRIQRRAVQNIVYRVSERAGKRVNPHRLRHTAATILLRAGAGLEIVQDVLGHASPATTRIYAKSDLAGLRRAIDRAPILGARLRMVAETEAGAGHFLQEQPDSGAQDSSAASGTGSR